MTPSFTVTQLFLRLRLWFFFVSWTTLLGAVLCVAGVAASLLWLPYLKQTHGTLTAHRIDAQQSLHQPATVASAPALPEPEQHLQAFYNNLGEARYTEQQVKTLFDLAAKSGLSLNQGEYKLAFDKNGQFQTYTIVLPVKGAYLVVRQFCEHVLLSIPFASLDEIHFKRESIATPTLEATLRFTLFLHPDSRVSPSMAPVEVVPGETI